jgi:hypothetical protein
MIKSRKVEMEVTEGQKILPSGEIYEHNLNELKEGKQGGA